MTFTYSFKKWFKLITTKYNDYDHAIFFGSLVPSWLWGDLMPWKVEPVTLYKKFDSEFQMTQDPEVSNAKNVELLYFRSESGKLTVHCYYVKEV